MWRHDPRQVAVTIELPQQLHLPLGHEHWRRVTQLAPHLLFYRIGMRRQILRRVSHGPGLPRSLLRGLFLRHDQTIEYGQRRRLRPDPAAERSEQDQTIQPIGVADGNFLGDGAAHGKPEQVNARKPQMVQQTRYVRGHIGKFVARIRLFAAAGAAVVKYDNAQTARQTIDERRRPGEAAEAIAVYQAHRRPFSGDVVVKRDLAVGRKRHMGWS